MSFDPYLDPYPDLPDAAMGTEGEPGERAAPVERPELSDADSRLLDALSRPAPPVVRAVEDEPRTTGAAREERVVVRRPPGLRGLAPVFREPTG